MRVDSSYPFEASTDRNSKDFFTLEYDRIVDKWCIDDGQSTDAQAKEIPTNSVNFYNDPDINVEADHKIKADILKAKEENKLFPPHFVLYVKNPEYTGDTELDTNIHVVLHKESIDSSDLKIPFKILVPKYPAGGDKPCGHCGKIPKFNELIQYRKGISSDWKYLALVLGISCDDVDIINENNHGDVEKKCYDMLSLWLKRETSACWCRFIQALHKVELHKLAEEVQAKHLTRYIITACAAPSTGNVISVEHGTLNPHRLMRFLRTLNDELDCDLYFFVTYLLPENGIEVIKDIKTCGSREDKITKICQVFLSEEDASWNRFYEALIKADFHGVAETVKSCYL